MKPKIKLRGAEYIVRIIELLDARDLFAYPGGAILPIYDALAYSSLNCVLVRHEQGAAFMANGYAR
ncbi:MAG TPA: thiamine pyrophosphate-binding protein, partial [Cytophaga sp.]|nr:thiamine pyrophosphate-binding protein [Cytophaga sp.]